MADNPNPIGPMGRQGRGAMIARLLELARPPGAPSEGDGAAAAPPQAAAPPPVQELPPRSSGRGAILQRLGQPPLAGPTPAPSVPVGLPAPTPTAPRVGMGRGTILQRLQQEARAQAPAAPTSPAPPTAPAPAPAPVQAAQVEHITRRMRAINVEQPPNVNMGTEGRHQKAVTNYIQLYLKEGRGIYEYEVKFSPSVDDRAAIYKMLFGQHKDLLGKKLTPFDGVTLYLPKKLEVSSVTSSHPVTQQEHTISFIFRKQRSMFECVHFYNVLFNNIQKELGLVRLGREYFCQNLATQIPQHRLEIWPGYVTAVDAYEGGIMLNCNASHKVLQNKTVLQLMEDIIHYTGGGAQWKELACKQLVGQVVMTRKPVNVYRVDDIDFSKTPASTFKHTNGEEETYIDYHKRRCIKISDENQPLLVHRPKEKFKERRRGDDKSGGSGSGENFLMLIPELCYLTGLTDEMRQDFKVMKDVATVTRVNPNQRVKTLQKFIDSVRTNENCRELLDQWGLEVPEQLARVDARTMDPEPIIFGREVQTRGNIQADWSRDATSQHMLQTVDILNWLVVFVQRDERNAMGFVDMMHKVCPQMGVYVEDPVTQKLRDDKPETYLRALRENMTDKTQVVVVIFPTQREDRYSTIKKLCCVDRPIPSQVINSRTISKPDKLRSIVQKIALQINCKLGGSLWRVKIPFGNAMICGMDSYHDSKNKALSVTGFIASMNKHVTRWFSQVLIQSSNRELLDGMQLAMKRALQNYYQINGTVPDTIVVFRDGVGDGQLDVCKNFEVAALEKAFEEHAMDYKPAVLFIVCQKRINTRFFFPSQGGNYDNPPPGTVVDHMVTRRTLYDFFLVSQMVRQGTVTPTHYIVLKNSTKLSPDKVQKITYKMCHLYYNWPGTVRVPAPCQYAHKLAHLVGTSIHKEPSPGLCDKLFFL